MAHTALDEVKGGAFVRVDSGWRNFINADGSTQFQPEAGRYHLYISLACPWACRCFAVLKLKGLEDVISVTIVNPVWTKTRPDDASDAHCGWPITDSSGFARCSEDPVYGAKFVREIYEKAGDTVHKYSVPILYDTKLHTIVNNESSEILRMFDSEFQSLCKHPNVRISPAELLPQIDEVNAWVYPTINNGVYRAGFATTQEAYDVAIKEVEEGVERAEKLLSTNRYLLGSRFTEADIRLFVTLVRFDSVYTVHFKCNRVRIADHPNLTNYIREIYQIPGIAETVDMAHITHHYYRSHPTINPHRIVCAAPDFDFDKPHDRARLSGEPIGL